MQLKIESDNYLQINSSNGEELHTRVLWDGVMGEPSWVSGEARDPYDGEAYSPGATGGLCRWPLGAGRTAPGRSCRRRRLQTHCPAAP